MTGINLADLFDRSTRRATNIAGGVNIDEVNSALRSALSSIQGDIEDSMRRMVVRIDDTVVAYTPVDLGTARSGWLPSIGDPRTDAPERGGAGVDHEGSQGRESTRALAATWGLGQGPFWLSNNVEYVPLLNEGSSPQAGAGYIEQAVADAVNSLAGTL